LVAVFNGRACTDLTCTTAAAWGITVEVSDNEGAPVAATVTFRDRDFVEVIGPEMRLGEHLYAGAVERAGTYEVTIEAEGFHTVTIKDVRVEGDECHVDTERLVVTLGRGNGGTSASSEHVFPFTIVGYHNDVPIRTKNKIR